MNGWMLETEVPWFVMSMRIVFCSVGCLAVMYSSLLLVALGTKAHLALPVCGKLCSGSDVECVDSV